MSLKPIDIPGVHYMYKQVSPSREALLDDIELEQVTKQLHTTEENFTKLTNELKKFPTVEKMINVVYFKILQQQVVRLQT